MKTKTRDEGTTRFVRNEKRYRVRRTECACRCTVRWAGIEESHRGGKLQEANGERAWRGRG